MVMRLWVLKISIERREERTEGGGQQDAHDHGQQRDGRRGGQSVPVAGRAHSQGSCVGLGRGRPLETRLSQGFG